MQIPQLIMWVCVVGVLVFIVLIFWMPIKVGRKEFSDPEFDAEEPSVPERFWRDKHVTKVKSNGNEKEI